MTITDQVVKRGLSIWLAVTLCGCGSGEYQKAAVTGSVTCNGAPAWGGVLMFTPVDAPDMTGRPGGSPGNVSLGKVEKDGTFRLEYQPRGSEPATDGALTGPHQVTFIPPMTEPRKWSKQDDWLPEEEKQQLKQQMAEEQVYPPLECGIAITPASVEVKSGKNEFAFTLSAEKPKRKSMPPKGGGSD